MTKNFRLKKLSLPKIWGLTIVLLTSSLLSSAQHVTGYFDASLNQAGTRLPQLQWSKMTDFIYGFIQPDGSGNLPDPTSLSHFNTCKTYCQNNNVKMHFSSGGATASGIFATIGANSTATANYAKEIADLLEAQGLDGFDLDWEFPTSAQYQTYQVNILKAIHDEFTARGKRDVWKIAIAVGGETPSVGAQGVYHTDYCSPNAFQYIDFLNIMSYDIGYGISGNDPNHSSYADAQNNVNDWVTKGCPIEKIVLGIPFYARHSTSRWASVYGSTYGDLIAANPSAGYNSDNGGSDPAYYYNGKTTCENKVDYIMNAGGAGVMIWEITYDYLADPQYSLLTALADAMAPYQCSAPTPSLGNDQSICGVSSITLNSNVSTAAGRTFTWKKGGNPVVTNSPTATTYNATSADTYVVEVSENGCSSSDEIIITGTLESIDLAGPYELCSPIEVTLDAGISTAGKTIVWKKNNTLINGETGASLLVNRAGTYKIEVSATGCSTVNATAIVTSAVPYADNDTLCEDGQATLIASESVNWYATENAVTPLSTGTTYSPNVLTNTTYWIEGTGAQATSYTTMKNAFAGGWHADPNVYATKFTALTDITIDEVTINASSGSVKINLVESDGVTPVATKTFSSVSGETALALNFTVPAGTYYLNAVGTTNNIWVDPNLDPSDYSVAGVITVNKSCFADWSSPYGDNYQTSTNYGNFIKLKVTAGSACDRVPVSVIIDANNPECLFTGTNEILQNISIYPNPSNNNFNLSNESANEIKVQIIDLKGAIVEQFTANNTLVSFGNNLQPGIYMVQLQNNNSIETLKIIKTK